MIKDNQKTFNRLHVVIDAVMITGAYLLSYPIRFRLLDTFRWFEIPPGTGYLKLQEYAIYLIFIVPGYLILYSLCGLYKPKRARRSVKAFISLIQANCLGALYFAFIIFLSKEDDLSRGFFVVFAAINLFFGVLYRYMLIKLLRIMRKKGLNQKHVLLVGYSRAAESYIDRLVNNPDWGYHTMGILDDNMEIGTAYKKISVIGTIEELPDFLAGNDLDEIVIAISIRDYARLEGIVNICEKSGVHTKFVPDYNGVIASNPYMEDIYGLPVINIRNVPLSNTFNQVIKRMFDLIGSAAALAVFGIPMIIVAVIIKATSRGPVIYSQTRVGLHGREFKMFKFRSMRVQKEEEEKKEWTTCGDPRVTKFGRFIRRTSIDELPQLFNILVGTMSLVGPRPERPLFVEKFKEEIPRYMIKHQVRPGMTGWAQVNGYRGDTSIPRRIKHDLYYIEHWSISFDVKILFLTVFRGFVNKNAY